MSPTHAPPPPSPAGPHVVCRPEQAAALLDPLRLRLLRHAEFPISASGLARRLRLPRQKVNYHVRELEKRGLVRVVRERRVGNCTERVVQAVAREFVLSPEILGPLAAEPRRPAERTLLVTVRLPDESARGAFELELLEAMGRLADEHGVAEGDAGESWQVVVGLHPAERQRPRLPDPRVP